MGLGQNTGRNTYVNISKGRLVVKKDGEVHEYGFVEGHLVDIEIVDDEYQGDKFKKLSLKFNDGKENYILQMRLDSGYGRAFCCIIPNANLELPMKISPSFKDDRGGMFINQSGSALKWYFTKDNPNGLPQLKKVELRGKTQWDNYDQQEFFIDLLLNKIKPSLKHEALAGPATPVDQEPGGEGMPPAYVPDANDIKEPLNDLPF